MTNRKTAPKSTVQSTVETPVNSQEATTVSNTSTTTTTAAESVAEKLTSYNVTASVLRKLPEGGYKFVLSFRPTVRGSEFWASLGAAVKSHISAPQTVEKTDDHLIVADKNESDVVTHWAIVRSGQRCPVCGQPKATPSDWCVAQFCEDARVATPAEKKARRVENPAAIDF